jgi:hypothetical protein
MRLLILKLKKNQEQKRLKERIRGKWGKTRDKLKSSFENNFKKNDSFQEN